jgi:hypothetical protein
MKDIKQCIQYKIKCLNDQVLSHSRLLEFIDFLAENPRYFILEFEYVRRVINNLDFTNEGLQIPLIHKPCWNLRIGDAHTGTVSVVTWGVANWGAAIAEHSSTACEIMNNSDNKKISKNKQKRRVKVTSTVPEMLSFDDLKRRFTA